MYDNTVDRDYVRTELEYRLGRIQSDFAGRRRRRLRQRQSKVRDVDGLTWTTVR